MGLEFNFTFCFQMLTWKYNKLGKHNKNNYFANVAILVIILGTHCTFTASDKVKNRVRL